jgi:spore coat protein U-like protein
MGRPRRIGTSWLCVGIATLAVATASARLHALTATANLTVTATVITSCTVTGGSLAFGNYDPTLATNLDQNGSFIVACTKGTSPIVGLNNGANFATSRRMSNGTDFLEYEIYKETGRTNIWGNAGGAAVTLGPMTTNAPQTVTVFGRVTPAQNVGTGGYSDTVLITVTF